MPEETVVETVTPEASPVVETPESEVAKPEGSKQEGDAKEEAKPAEKTPAEKQAEEKERLRASRIADQLKREQKFRSERLSWEKQRDADKKALETERAEFSKDLEKLKSTRATLDKFVGELKSDPIKVLEKYFGIGPEQYYHRVMNNGKADPREEINSKYEQLQKQLEEERAWRANWEKTQKEREEESKKQQEERARAEAEKARAERQGEAKKQFFDFISKDKSKYADLLLYDQELLFSQARSVVDGLLNDPEHGGSQEERNAYVESLSFEDLANLMQDRLSGWHKRIREAGQKPEQSASPGEANGDAKSGAKPVSTEDEIEAVVKGAEKKATEKARRGSVRTATTLSGEMSTRTSAKTKTNDWEEAKKKLVAELGG